MVIKLVDNSIRAAHMTAKRMTREAHYRRSQQIVDMLFCIRQITCINLSQKCIRKTVTLYFDAKAKQTNISR